MNKNIHKIVVVNFTLLFVYIVYRAINLSITHDESGTFFHHIGKPFLSFFTDINSWQDANNHLLNTFLMQISTKLFGNSEIALRLPNVLASIVYFYYCYKIIIAIAHSNMQILLLQILLIANPFLLDFFSLARGYGLCLAFGTASIFYLYKSIKNHFLFNDLWKWSLFSVLMFYANFIGLQLYFSSMAILVFYFFYKKSFSQIKLSSINLAAIILLSFTSIFLPTYKILLHLSEIGEFKYGSTSFLSFVN